MRKYWIIVIGSILTLSACGGKATSSINSTSAVTISTATRTNSTSAASTSTATRTKAAETVSSTRPATTQAVAATIPGLPATAASHIELRKASKGRFVGMPAYDLTLSTGHIWAIKGSTATVVPKVMADPSFNENTGGFFHAGSYVLYMPSLFDGPQAFVDFMGPRPGMTLIDTDVDLSNQ